jgi:hypothetical protein
LLESHIPWEISWREDAKDLTRGHRLARGALTGRGLHDIGRVGFGIGSDLSDARDVTEPKGEGGLVVLTCKQMVELLRSVALMPRVFAIMKGRVAERRPSSVHLRSVVRE